VQPVRTAAITSRRPARVLYLAYVAIRTRARQHPLQAAAPLRLSSPLHLTVIVAFTSSAS
jgi:hypothetical protein